MTICALLHDADAQDLRNRLQSQPGIAPFDWFDITVLDEGDRAGVARVAAAFGAPQCLIASAGHSNGIYNSTLFEDASSIRQLQRTIEGLIETNVSLSLSKIGLLFFRDWEEVSSVRFLAGPPNGLSLFGELNHGFQSSRFILATGRVQLNAYDPLLFQVVFAPTRSTPPLAGG